MSRVRHMIDGMQVVMIRTESVEDSKEICD